MSKNRNARKRRPVVPLMRTIDRNLAVLGPPRAIRMVRRNHTDQRHGHRVRNEAPNAIAITLSPGPAFATGAVTAPHGTLICLIFDRLGQGCHPFTLEHRSRTWYLNSVS